MFKLLKRSESRLLQSASACMLSEITHSVTRESLACVVSTAINRAIKKNNQRRQDSFFC